MAPTKRSVMGNNGMRRSLTVTPAPKRPPGTIAKATPLPNQARGLRASDQGGMSKLRSTPGASRSAKAAAGQKPAVAAPSSTAPHKFRRPPAKGHQWHD